MSAVPVTFVSSHAQLGGAERYLEAVLRHLEPEWVRSVVSLQDGPFVDRLKAAGHDPVVIHTSGSPPAILAASWRLRSVLRRHRPAVVHANGVKAALMCALAGPGLGVPLVWVKHDFSWDGPLARVIARRCTEVVGVSRAVTEDLAARVRVSVVPPGLEPRAVEGASGRALVRRLMGAPAQAPVIVLMGRLHPVKGHHEVLAALPQLCERVPDVRVAFVGGEDPNHRAYAADLRRSVNEAGLDGVVRFLGYQEDGFEVLAGADVVVIPSVRDERGMGREGLSMVALEAMAAGTPVVAYGHGGLPEAVGECGRLVAAGERRALADAVADLLTDTTLADRLAECGRRRVHELFSLDATVEAMKGRYREVAV